MAGGRISCFFIYVSRVLMLLLLFLFYFVSRFFKLFCVCEMGGGGGGSVVWNCQFAICSSFILYWSIIWECLFLFFSWIVIWGYIFILPFLFLLLCESILCSSSVLRSIWDTNVHRLFEFIPPFKMPLIVYSLFIPGTLTLASCLYVLSVHPCLFGLSLGIACSHQWAMLFKNNNEK